MEELRRREGTLKVRSKIIPCDECKHFTPDGCAQGHMMSFRVPSTPNPSDEVWGFYRPGCRDRRTDEAENMD